MENRQPKTLAFETGAYSRGSGHTPPAIQINHHNGERIRFIAGSPATSPLGVTVIRIAASGGVTNTDRDLDVANEIFRNAIANGYYVTHNAAGGDHEAFKQMIMEG